MSRKVVLASPGTLLALLRTVGLHLAAGRTDGERPRAARARAATLYSRLGTLGSARHEDGPRRCTGRSRSYNALVGTLESRVLVTARRMHDLGLVEAVIPEVQPIEQAPRPLTAAELLEALDADVARPQLDLDGEVARAAPVTGPRRHTA